MIYPLDRKGRFTLVLGPMHSGKTEYLVNSYKFQRYTYRSATLVRPDIDGRPWYFDIPYIKVKRLDDYTPVKDIIYVDELQFFENAGRIINQWCSEGVIVIAAGLSATTDLQPWPEISNAIPYVDEIKWLTSVCEKCHDASVGAFSYYDGQKDIVSIDVDDDRYHVYCRNCMQEMKYET